MQGVTLTQAPQDWQILQQQNGFADIPVAGTWSWPDPRPGAVVAARIFLEESSRAITPWTHLPTTPDGTFAGVLKAIAAGGPYRLETCLVDDTMKLVFEWGGRGDMRHHLGVGDLFLLAGQSNCVGYAKDSISDPPRNRRPHVRRQWLLVAGHPSPRRLHRHPLPRQHGNLPLRPLPPPPPRQAPAQNLWLSHRPGPDRPGWLVAGRLEPRRGRHALPQHARHRPPPNVRAVIWYQGCSDVAPNLCEIYLPRFANFVAALRDELAQPDLPVFTAQLNRHIAFPETAEGDRGWGLVREAQRQAARTIANVLVIPTTDAAMSDFIHNSAAGNLLLAERWARQAASHLHGKPTHCRAPDLRHARQTAPTQVELTFDRLLGRLYLYEGDVRHDQSAPGPRYCPFTIEDQSGPNPFTAWQATAHDRILLTTARPIAAPAVSPGAQQRNPTERPPVDDQMHPPILSFYGVPVAYDPRRLISASPAPCWPSSPPPGCARTR